MPTESVDSLDDATGIFGRYRDHLFSVAYSMLGTVADTEDVLQETWLSWASAQRSAVVNQRAYLVRIATNAALSKLRKARDERTTYVGPWLPEPLVSHADGADHALRSESVSLAMLVVLETLSPLERAVFVLHEAFGYRHAEIASIVDRSPAAVRQIFRRARAHVEERRPRYRADATVQREVTERFLAAATGGDVDALLAVLAPDAVFWSDGGGKRRAARNVIRGREKVARFITAVKDDFAEATMEFVVVNGDVGMKLSQDGAVIAIGVVDIAPDGSVRSVYGVLNPDKLLQIAASPPATGSDTESG